MKHFLALLVLLSVNACDSAKYYNAVAVEQKKEYNDTQAGLYVQVPCDMTIGAFNRTLTDAQQRAVMALCGANTESHITAEDVQAIQDFMELRERSRDAVAD